MPTEQRVLIVGVAVLFVLAILELVRKRLLREEYSWLWLLAGISILGAALLPFDVLLRVSERMGSKNPSAGVFFFGFCALIALCLQFSVRLSRMTEQLKNLGQKVSLLEAELERTPTDDPPS